MSLSAAARLIELQAAPETDPERDACESGPRLGGQEAQWLRRRTCKPAHPEEPTWDHLSGPHVLSQGLSALRV